MKKRWGISIQPFLIAPRNRSHSSGHPTSFLRAGKRRCTRRRAATESAQVSRCRFMAPTGNSGCSVSCQTQARMGAFGKMPSATSRNYRASGISSSKQRFGLSNPLSRLKRLPPSPVANLNALNGVQQEKAPGISLKYCTARKLRCVSTSPTYVANLAHPRAVMRWPRQSGWGSSTRRNRLIPAILPRDVANYGGERYSSSAPFFGVGWDALLGAIASTKWRLAMVMPSRS